MDNKSKCGCVLIINTEEQHPEIVTKVTGVEATSLTVKGKPRINEKTGKYRPATQHVRNAWEWDPGHVYGSEWQIEDAICKTLDMIHSHPSFKTVFSTFKECFIRGYAYIYDYNIVFGFSTETLHKLTEVGIPIEFDLYSFDEEN